MRETTKIYQKNMALGADGIIRISIWALQQSLKNGSAVAPTSDIYKVWLQAAWIQIAACQLNLIASTTKTIVTTIKMTTARISCRSGGEIDVNASTIQSMTFPSIVSFKLQWLGLNLLCLIHSHYSSLGFIEAAVCNIAEFFTLTCFMITHNYLLILSMGILPPKNNNFVDEFNPPNPQRGHMN